MGKHTHTQCSNEKLPNIFKKSALKEELGILCSVDCWKSWRTHFACAWGFTHSILQNSFRLLRFGSLYSPPCSFFYLHLHVYEKKIHCHFKSHASRFWDSASANWCAQQNCGGGGCSLQALPHHLQRMITKENWSCGKGCRFGRGSWRCWFMEV